MRGQDLNLRPSGYEPDEMSGFLRVLRRVANVSQIGAESGYFFMLSLATPRDFSNDLMPPSPKSESVKDQKNAINVAKLLFNDKVIAY